MHGRKLITTGTVAALAILAVVGGCKEATTGPTSVNPQDFASSLKLLSGNQQIGAAGAPLSELLSVKVVDAGGQAVAGATVIWQVRDGGGTVNPAASTSSVSGLATVVWTLGSTLGANKAVAVLQGAYALDSAVFTATAKVGLGRKFVKVSGDSQTTRVASKLAQPLVVNMTDQYGHPIAGDTVQWQTLGSSGTLTAASTTDASGNASANWTLDTLATYGAFSKMVRATAGGVAIDFYSAATPDTSRRVSVVSGASPAPAPIGSPMPSVTVKVTDQWGNRIVGAPVIWTDSLAGGAAPASSSGTTDASGLVSTTWTFGNRIGTQLMRVRETTNNVKSAAITGTATTAFTQVYAGNFFTCGVSTNARAFCWGFGEDGQRGIPTAMTSNLPGAGVTTTDTLTGPFPSWRQMGAGSSYICGISIARQLYCWGRLASATQFIVPTLKSFTDVLAFTAVSTSETHSCLLTTGGVIGCTGSNAQGQLGDGTKADQLADYVVAAGVASLDWSSVAVGGSHTCAFPRYNPAPSDSADTKRPRCWGANGSGQLGGGTITQNSVVPVPVTMADQMIAWDTTSLVAGNAHNCALTRTGAAYCWGANGYGQLGNTTRVRDSLPQPVAGVPAFSKLYAGEYHTCGITAAGDALCWGRNDSGQLGNGSTSTLPVPPSLVVGGRTWRMLAMGERHTCGVTGTPGATDAGTIYCWGGNDWGQLGLGNSETRLTPTKVNGQP